MPLGVWGGGTRCRGRTETVDHAGERGGMVHMCCVCVCGGGGGGGGHHQLEHTLELTQLESNV